MSTDTFPYTHQAVQLISNSLIRGVVTGRTKKFSSVTYVEIEIDARDRKFVPVDDLEPVRPKLDGIEELLECGQFGGIADLARLLIFQKISSNLSNVFYAMHASRTDFHAYQFKSVYKFIESFNNRLLIADEVGLGKTIEAGLIWLEARARTDARRLLVVCPSMLKAKWKKELRFRFDTRAEEYDAKALRGLVDEFLQEGESFQCAVVCSLNSVRQNSVQEALQRLEESPLRFDLVVIDEAHHMRNVGTKSHAVGRTLSDLTDAMVLLTATPIHLGNQDLYRLLNLLDREEFAELWQFSALVEENEPIVQAQNFLRSYPPRIGEAHKQLLMAAEYPAFSGNSNINQAIKKLERLVPESHREMVDIGLLLEKLNLFSSHISRTRKREVSEWRVVREAISLKVQFTLREARFYRAVTEAVQNRIESSSYNKILAFSLMMPQRQMASCIPAMVEHYRDSSFEVTVDNEILEEIGVDSEDFGADEAPTEWLELEQIIQGWDDNTPDSKFDVLLDALRKRFEREPDVKVIIFSYFKKTLRYLERRLSAKGFQTTLIDGDIPMDERQLLIEKLQNEANRRILLSSEVGSEGIDLQFCRIVFNYDLPWNPMKVEQRIGRVDRLGQKAEKISIVNFAVRDTIEEKILNRLYDRIGIFEKSLGDLEPILGELTQELSFDLLRRRLTPEQEAERIEQTLLAAENKRLQEEELVEQSSVFLGTADYILEQIGLARDLGRRITNDDLRRFIDGFFTNANYHGTSVMWDKPQAGLVKIKLSSSAQSDLHSFCRNQSPPLFTRLSSSTGTGEILAVASDLAQSIPHSEMLNHFHPLVQWIRHEYENDPDSFVPTSAVEVATEKFPAGDYLIAVQFWMFSGIKTSKRIEYGISAINSVSTVDLFEAESLMKEILEFGKTWQYASLIVKRDSLLTGWSDCNQKLGIRYEEAFELFSEDNTNLTARRQSHLQSFSKRKEESIEKAIQTMRDRNDPESKLKGFYAMLEKRQRQKREEFEKLESQSRVSKHFSDVAAVLCRVINK